MQQKKTNNNHNNNKKINITNKLNQKSSIESPSSRKRIKINTFVLKINISLNKRNYEGVEKFRYADRSHSRRELGFPSLWSTLCQTKNGVDASKGGRRFLLQSI